MPDKSTTTTAKKINSYKFNSLRCKKAKPHTANKAPKKAKIKFWSKPMFVWTSSFFINALFIFNKQNKI